MDPGCTGVPPFIDRIINLIDFIYICIYVYIYVYMYV